MLLRQDLEAIFLWEIDLLLLLAMQIAVDVKCVFFHLDMCL